MCGYLFLSLLIVTQGKSIFCAFSVFLYLYVGIKVWGHLFYLYHPISSKSLMYFTASSSTVKVISFFGDNVTLPCRYDTQTYGVLSFCWGKGEVPMSKCSNTILSSVDGAVVFRQSHRYHLQGRMKDGDVSLTIRNAQWSDAMVYGCRVEIPGWFNDYKVNIHLIIEEGKFDIYV